MCVHKNSFILYPQFSSLTSLLQSTRLYSDNGMCLSYTYTSGGALVYSDRPQCVKRQLCKPQRNAAIAEPSPLNRSGFGIRLSRCHEFPLCGFCFDSTSHSRHIYPRDNLVRRQACNHLQFSRKRHSRTTYQIAHRRSGKAD